MYLQTYICCLLMYSCIAFILSYSCIYTHIYNSSYSLAEEVDRRTDVRGKGMQGFYTNLLTKNIAMGGDVSTSAVSACTAGSERQYVLVYGKDETDVKGQNYDKDTVDVVESTISSTSEREQQVPTLGSNSAVVGSKRSLEPYIDREDDRSHTTPTVAAPHITTTTTTTTTLEHTDKKALQSGAPSMEGKEKAVLSARERYLARTMSRPFHMPRQQKSGTVKLRR